MDESADRKLTPEEIAQLAKERGYREPGRELMASKPANPDASNSRDPYTGGAGGDVANPTAVTDSKMPKPYSRKDITTDERARLAKGKGA